MQYNITHKIVTELNHNELDVSHGILEDLNKVMWMGWGQFGKEKNIKGGENEIKRKRKRVYIKGRRKP